jgi:hypothetical protein
MKPETLGASELTYEKFSLNELRAKAIARNAGYRLSRFHAKLRQILPDFHSVMFCKVFKPNIFEFSKQPNKK